MDLSVKYPQTQRNRVKRGHLSYTQTFVTVGFDPYCDFICDGTSDHVQLQEAIDFLAANGGGTVFLRSGVYNINTKLVIPKLGFIRIAGEKMGGYAGNENSGSPAIIARSAMTSIIEFSGDSFVNAYTNLAVDFSIQGVILTGNNLAPIAIKARNAQQVTISDCRIRSVNQSFVTEYTGINPVLSTSIPGRHKVFNNILSGDNGAYVIDLQYASDSFVYGNECYRNTASPSAWVRILSGSNISITNNHFHIGIDGIRLEDTVADKCSDITIGLNKYIGLTGDLINDTRGLNANSARIVVWGDTTSAGGVSLAAVNADSNMLGYATSLTSYLQTGFADTEEITTNNISEKTSGDGIKFTFSSTTPVVGDFSQIHAYETGTVSNRGLYFSNGSPEGNIASNIGSLAIDYTAGANTFFIKTTHAASTGWTNILTNSGTQTISGAKTFTQNMVLDRSAFLSPVFFTIDGQAGQDRLFNFRTSGVERWKFKVTGTAEAGADIGSNFVIERLSDAGVSLGNVLEIVRQTGKSTFKKELSITSGTATGNTVNIDQQSGLITTASLTTAAGADETITLNNTFVAANSRAFVTMMEYNGTQGFPIVREARASAGQLTVLLNNIDAVNALDGTVKLSFLILNS